MITRAEREVFTEQLRRRRGRPRSAEPVVATSVKLPEPVYDALCRRARDERRSLHAVIKDALKLYGTPEFR